MKVLVVDDDEVVLQWVRKQLEARNYDVEDAFSGEQGLHYYLSQGPTTWDFVLSDYLFVPSTKIQEGLQLVREIRAINPQQRMAVHTSEENLRAPGCPCYISHIELVGCSATLAPAREEPCTSV